MFSTPIDSVALSGVTVLVPVPVTVMVAAFAATLTCAPGSASVDSNVAGASAAASSALVLSFPVSSDSSETDAAALSSVFLPAFLLVFPEDFCTVLSVFLSVAASAEVSSPSLLSAVSASWLSLLFDANFRVAAASACSVPDFPTSASPTAAPAVTQHARSAAITFFFIWHHPFCRRTHGPGEVLLCYCFSTSIIHKNPVSSVKVVLNPRGRTGAASLRRRQSANEL